MHVATSFARNLGGLIRARISSGPVQEGESRTLNMDVDEESDRAIVCCPSRKLDRVAILDFSQS